jgi:putative mRNA 3-end processing factor
LGDFYLDPKKAVATALISHAHGDHAVATRGIVYCTEPTRSFMEHRFGAKLKAEFISTKYEESFSINGIVIRFFPAGHILGSAQILMTYEGVRYLYTGDFKTQTDESCEQFQYVMCDHLITETTFASPEYFHPDPVEEIKMLFSENRKVIIGAYALGKAQRLTHLISKYVPEITLFVHPDLEAYHTLYTNHGYSPGNWHSYRKKEFEEAERAAFIVPPAYFRSYKNNEVVRAFATGWKRSFYRCDKVLRISDHADWPGVLDMVERTKAKNIYTVHGNGEFLKEHLKDIHVTVIG